MSAPARGCCDADTATLARPDTKPATGRRTRRDWHGRGFGGGFLHRARRCPASDLPGWTIGQAIGQNPKMSNGLSNAVANSNAPTGPIIPTGLAMAATFGTGTKSGTASESVENIT